MKHLILLSIVLLATLSAQAQTQDTNDVRVTWNVQMQLSTNQFQTWQYFWRKSTNGMANPPLITVSFAGAARELVNVQLAQLAEQRRQEKALETSWLKLQAAWLEMTPLQQSNVLFAAGLTP